VGLGANRTRGGDKSFPGIEMLNEDKCDGMYEKEERAGYLVAQLQTFGDFFLWGDTDNTEKGITTDLLFLKMNAQKD
jgi:hypothetical protein